MSMCTNYRRQLEESMQDEICDAGFYAQIADEAPTEELRELIIHYPRARIRCRWVKQDCMMLDGVPYIGRYSPGTPELYVLTGFNKWA